MVQDAFPERSKGHRLTAREWNDHCRELRKLRDIKGINGVSVKTNSGGIIIEGLIKAGNANIYPCVATEYGWHEIDAETGLEKENGLLIEYYYVYIMGSLGLTYPLYTTPPVDYELDRRTKGYLIKENENSERYTAIIPDFTQTYNMVCTDAEEREFTECDGYGNIPDGARVVVYPVIIGDVYNVKQLTAYPDDPTAGLHTLIPSEYNYQWTDAVIIGYEPGYAYYYA